MYAQIAPLGRYVEGLAAECAHSDKVRVVGAEPDPPSVTLGFHGLLLPVRNGSGAGKIERRDALVRIYFGPRWPAHACDWHSALLFPPDILHPNIKPPILCDGAQAFAHLTTSALVPPVALLLHHYRVLVADPRVIQLDDAFPDPEVTDWYHELLARGALPTDRRPLFRSPA